MSFIVPGIAPGNRAGDYDRSLGLAASEPSQVPVKLPVKLIGLSEAMGRVLGETMVKRRNWWVAGGVAFILGISVGSLGDRNWQRGLAMGAIGLSAVITVGTLRERRRLDSSDRPKNTLKPNRRPLLGSTGLAFLDTLPLDNLKTSVEKLISRPKKLALPAAKSKPSLDLKKLWGSKKSVSKNGQSVPQMPPPQTPPPQTQTSTQTRSPIPPQPKSQLASPPLNAPPRPPIPESLTQHPAVMAPPTSLAQLQTQLQQVNDRRHQVEAVISVLRKERDELQSQILEETQQKQSLYRVLSDLEIRNVTLEEQLDQQQKAVEILTQQKEDLERAIATMDSLGGEVEKLRQERERLTQEVQALESRDAKLRRDYGVLENKARKLVQRLKQLKNNVR